ncbi:transglycosylase domain-containing protein [Sphingomonas sp. ASV193]|uniref:transglycosylase domain-containing protein n=1 Tax=Sphingomonas sp. ASV193 TaxID=3144405 RepID=UPI0032E8F0E8
MEAEHPFETDGPWRRGGLDIEQLPDPFAPPPPPPPAEEAKPRRRWKRWQIVGSAIGALFLVTILWLVITAPLGRALEPLRNPAMLLVSEEGRPIALRGAIKEAPVDAAKLNPQTPAAFIAIEDRRFRSHWGIDVHAIGRAALANLRAGGVKQGGSTITQQLAKTSFLSSNRSMKRKAQEVIIAFWLEAWLSKDEILSRYLSSVYFGDGVYGLRAAAHHYFGREPEKLTLAQSAMLAGIVNAPSRLDPYDHLAAAQARGRLVLQEMADTRVISLARARATPSARPIPQRSHIPSGTYFADWVAPQAQGAFESDYGQVKVRTTLDSDLQRLATRAIAGAPAGSQAALVAMRPDGRVVAMVGGRDYAASPFNRAVQARRQPGSAFKLFVYLAAMRAGYTPDSLVEDRPVTIGGWSPKNSDGVYRGQITLREAFARSSNAATVRLAEKVGRGNVIRAARDLGIASPLDDKPSLALGTSGVSLLELTGAYAALASGHYPVAPTGLPPDSKAEESGFTQWLGRGGTLDRGRDWAPMLDLLWSAANQGTGRRAALSIATFGKTGTTQDNRDALFVGFAGDLVVGVWVGRDDNSSLGAVTGGSAPAQIWRAFMAPAIAIDRQAYPALPWRAPQPQPSEPTPGDWQSPLPPGFDDPDKVLRKVGDFLDQLFGDERRGR